MYLKVLNKHKDERSTTFVGFRSVSFWRTRGSGGDFTEVWRRADEEVLAGGQAEIAESIDPVIWGNLLIKYPSGAKQFVVFDGTAFLCDDSGKATERYQAFHSI